MYLEVMKYRLYDFNYLSHMVQAEEILTATMVVSKFDQVPISGS